MGEAVVFLFIKDRDVLLEFRPRGVYEEMHIPGGGIEHGDKNIDEKYAQIAMKREIAEELGEQIKVLAYQYAGNTIREETGSRYFAFLVTKWKGEIPSHIKEKGEPDSRLVWICIDDALKLATTNVRKFALSKAKEFIHSRSPHETH